LIQSVLAAKEEAAEPVIKKLYKAGKVAALQVLP
jgi:hypothetical protein